MNVRLTPDGLEVEINIQYYMVVLLFVVFDIDDHGREPLFTTPTRRLYDTILRKDMYAITRPCSVGQDCPHDRDLEECEATNKKQASKCPPSISAHPLRRSAITYHLNQNAPKEKVSERADDSVSVLEKHYDARTEDERAAGRRQILDRL